MIVIKYGGNAMRDEDGAFSKAVGQAITQGKKIVIVHGGGPQINEALAKKRIESSWVCGLRVTTQEIFDVVEDVLVNKVGPSLAISLQKHGVNAKSISARSFPTVIAERMTVSIDGQSCDVGLVGHVLQTNPMEIIDLLESGTVPVVAPIASAIDRSIGYNVNADFVAAAIAAALHASALIIMTDVAGIYRSWPDKGSLIEKITAHDLESIKSTFSDGMSPKVQATLDAISYGVNAVRIVDGTDPQALADALAGHGGTLVLA
jgi:acetylglutamate kinase